MKKYISWWKYFLFAAAAIAGTSFIISRNAGEEKFNHSKFVNPDPFYMPGYFWSWNDTMTRDLMVRQMNDMVSRRAMTVCPLPIPSSFRPVNMPTMMTPDYLTDEYMEMFRFVAEKCRELGMVAYFYDEGGWPSGSCLGKVVAENPGLVRQGLVRQVITPAKGNIQEIPASCLTAFLYRGGEKIKKLTPGTRETITSDDSRILVFSVSKTGSYPDLLNPESTREFIRLTHDRYKKYIGQYFGNTFRIAFTDEPKAANPGWTDDLRESFSKRFGYDIIDVLPSIFEGDSDSDRKVRIDYYNWWSQRFTDAYFGQIQEWCRQNNLLSGGHLDGEDATANVRTYGYGHPLRALRKMDVPAVDVIWRQIWPGANNHHFPKYASTAAHQTGRPWAFTETFAVYGNGLTGSQMKWITDYQYVRGINLLVIGGYPLSKEDWLQAGCRPNFGPGDPVWDYMDVYHDYVGRLSYIMSLGKPDIKTALYYPVNDIWAGGEEFKAVCSSHDELARTLLENQCDFDLIDDDILGTGSSVVKNGRLVVSQMAYEAVCIPRNRYMPGNTVSKLEDFIGSGGKVYWVDDDENAGKIKGAIKTTISELPSHLNQTAVLREPVKGIRICKRLLEKSSVYLITNEDTCSNTFTVEFFEDMPPSRLDPETGKCLAAAGAVRKPQSWEIPLDLGFAGSAVFIFTDEVLPASPGITMTAKVLQTISGGWTCRKAEEYIIGSHRMEIRKNTDPAAFKLSPGDWSQALGNSFSGDAEYQVRFNCTSDVAKKAVCLDLGEVRYFCEASLNGRKLGKRIWEPFGFEIGGLIKEGENNLVVTVTNTLANQYTTTKALDVWTKNQLGPYHARALAFEKESASGGLFGPVTLR